MQHGKLDFCPFFILIVKEREREREKLHLSEMSLFDFIPGSNLREKLQTVVSCNCCERHQINKPQVLAPWVETPWNNSQNYLTGCDCDCRHLARFICRYCDEDEDQDEQEQEPEEPETYYSYALSYNTTDISSGEIID